MDNLVHGQDHPDFAFGSIRVQIIGALDAVYLMCEWRTKIKYAHISIVFLGKPNNAYRGEPFS